MSRGGAEIIKTGLFVFVNRVFVVLVLLGMGSCRRSVRGGS